MKPDINSIVPDMRRGEEIRIGPIWFMMMIPNQYPVLHIDIKKPIIYTNTLVMLQWASVQCVALS